MKRPVLHSCRRRGSALIVTLFCLLLATILIVGLAASSSFERKASFYDQERLRADAFASMGVDHAIALLQTATGQTNQAWISQPGRITLLPSGTNALSQTFDLSSGAANTNLSGSVKAPNLNPRAYDGSTLLGEGSDAMPVRWIYVRQDGALDLADSPVLTRSNNPIVGRYAFWTDDAGARINLNTAWTRDAANTNALGHPSRVSLLALTNMTAALADEIAQAAGVRSFNSPADAGRVDPALAAVLGAGTAPFAVTHYSHDTDLNPFGQPKMVLTTQKSLAGGSTNFLDILAADNADPGTQANLSATKTAAVVNQLWGYLTNTSWPVAPGRSFAQKYSPSSNTRIIQLAIDLIEYVRARESTNTIVEPIRGGIVGGKFVYGNAYTAVAQQPFLGQTRAPVITEMGYWSPKSIAAGATYYAGVAKVEIYLPPHFGISSLDLTTLRLFVSVGSSQYGWNYITAAELAPYATTLTAGNYAVVTRTNNAPNPRPQTTLRMALADALTNSMAICPIANDASALISCPVDPAGVATNAIMSVETDDPFLSQNAADWKKSLGAGGAGNSFGTANTQRSVGKAPTAVSPQPLQDTDGSGKLTDDGLRMPYPKGNALNPNGYVESLAELGFVHTGIESVATNGVPYRTLRFQPSGTTNAIPDWALLDLFKLPVPQTPVPTAMQAPRTNSVGGRVNVNAALQPFPNVLRTAPLLALLTGATNRVSGATFPAPGVAATNIIEMNRASQGVLFNTNGYPSIGAIAEIAGVADAGETSEQNLTEPLGLGTVRGNVFMVYSIGQAVKQTASGGLVVNGEARGESMIERDPASYPFRYRTLFWKQLTP